MNDTGHCGLWPRAHGRRLVGHPDRIDAEQGNRSKSHWVQAGAAVAEPLNLTDKSRSQRSRMLWCMPWFRATEATDMPEMWQAAGHRTRVDFSRDAKIVYQLPHDLSGHEQRIP
jgi:hypothetical protein